MGVKPFKNYACIKDNKMIIIVVQRHVYYCHLIVIFLSEWLNFYGEYWLNLGTVNNNNNIIIIHTELQFFTSDWGNLYVLLHNDDNNGDDNDNNSMSITKTISYNNNNCPQ